MPRCRTADAAFRQEPEEIYNLSWQHVDVSAERIIHIPSGKTKNAKRTLALTPTTCDLLLTRYQHQGTPREGWVFPAPTRSGHINDPASTQGRDQGGRDRLLRSVLPSAYILDYTRQLGVRPLHALENSGTCRHSDGYAILPHDQGIHTASIRTLPRISSQRGYHKGLPQKRETYRCSCSIRNHRTNALNHGPLAQLAEQLTLNQ
jgi:hypothetical protein